MMPQRRRKVGFALVLVLGVMLLLTVLVAAIAFTVRGELNVTAAFEDQVRARYLAHAGLHKALTELMSDNPGIDSYTETWTERRTEDEGWHSEDGTFFVRVIDESGKLNINTADRETLVAFFTQITDDGALAEEIADSIIDWRDGDEEPRLLGAESDYYLSLEQPYRAKNAPFDSPYELLLVKGITRDIFYGNPNSGIPPLPELVTAYSATPNVDERGLPRVNINTATREQLLEALGDILTEQEIDAILRFRDGTQQQPSGQQPFGQAPQIGTQPVPPTARPPIGQRPMQPGMGQTGFQRPQQPTQPRPSQQGQAGLRPSRGAPEEAIEQPPQGVFGVPRAGSQFGSGQRPMGSQGSGQMGGQTGGGQRRRQIRSPLDLRPVLPTEKLIAIWERITTTDQPVLYGLVNLNTAPPEVLAALLPDNPTAVDEILTYREQNGGFRSVGELLNITSLTQAELQRLVPRVCVKSATFRIRAAGIVGNHRAVHLIDVIVERRLNLSTASDTLTANESVPTVQFIVRTWKER